MPFGFLQITHKDPTDFDLLNDYASLTFTDTGTEEFSSGTLVLNAKHGKYITSSRKIDFFDRIYVQYQDPDGLIIDKMFEVTDKQPIRTKTGLQLEITLIDQAWHVDEIHFSKEFRFASGFEVAKGIVNVYNANKRSMQPTVIDHDNITGNKLGKWTANHYQFNVAEKRCYQGLLEVFDKLGASVDAGGEFEFFECAFTSDPTNINQTKIRIAASGSLPESLPGTPVIITNSDLTMPTHKVEGVQKAESGTLLGAWGAADAGSLPPDFSIFVSEEEAFNNYPRWDATFTYQIDSKVTYNDAGTDKVYKSLQNNNTNNLPTNPTYWSQISFTPSTDYSIWTKDKAGPFKNSGCDPTNVNGKRGCYDSNLVVWDKNKYRTDVRTKATDSGSISNTLKMRNGSGGFQFYRGFKVLVNGTPGAGDWSLNGGKDRSGKTYAQAIVIHNGGLFTGSEAYKNWDVWKTPINENLCAVKDEGKVYQFNGTSWSDISGSDNVNECFHQYTALDNDTGAHATLGANSAVHVKYEFPNPVQFSPSLSGDYYNIGCWLNVEFPYPVTTDNGISEHVGSLYGGENKANPEPVTLDVNNMNLTHSGNSGFSFNDSIDLGPLSALEFMLKFRWRGGRSASFRDPKAGDFKMRCALYDTFDNVVVQDFVIPFNNNWTHIVLPISGFQIYRARYPRIYGLLELIPPDELQILNQFEWRNIRSMVIQLQEVYDAEGRFHPIQSRFFLFFDAIGLVYGGQCEMWLDALRWTKPLLALSGTPSTITTENRSGTMELEPDFLQRPNTFNYVQLKNDLLTELAKAKFKHDEYIITTTAKADIGFADSFYYRDPELVRNADNGNNTVKLVNKKTTYKFTKAREGPSGATRELRGIKRIT